MNAKKPTPGHILIKMPNVKTKRTLKAERKNQRVTYKGAPIRLSTDFSTKTLQTGRHRHQIFQIMKSKDLQPRLLYQARLSFKMDGKVLGRQDGGGVNGSHTNLLPGQIWNYNNIVKKSSRINN